MSTQPPPSGQDPFDPRYPERLPPGFVPPQDFPRYPQEPSFPAGTHPGGAHPGGAHAEDPLVPQDLGGWFRRIVDVVRRSLVSLLILQAGVAVASAVFQIQFGGAAEEFTKATAAGADPATLDMSPLTGPLLIGVPILIFVSILSQASAIFVAIRDAAGQPTDLGSALRFGLTRVLPLLGWTIVMTIMLTVGFLLIIPGVYLVIVFGSSLVGVVVVERGTIARSFALVNPRLAPTAGRVLLGGVIVLAYTMLIGAVTGGFGPVSTFGAIMSAILSIPIGMAGIGFMVVTYAELRHHENIEVGTPQLAAELNR